MKFKVGDCYKLTGKRWVNSTKGCTFKITAMDFIDNSLIEICINSPNPYYINKTGKTSLYYLGQKGFEYEVVNKLDRVIPWL